MTTGRNGALAARFGDVIASPARGAPAKPKGKENGGVGGDSCPHGMEEKVEFSSPTLRSGLPCPSTLYTPPWPVEFRSLPCFASSSGWAEFENAPALTQGRGSALTHSDGLAKLRPALCRLRLPRCINTLSSRFYCSVLDMSKSADEGVASTGVQQGSSAPACTVVVLGLFGIEIDFNI